MSKDRAGTIAISWGPWGGVYAMRSRLCLGWVAFTVVRGFEIDDLMEAFADKEAAEADAARLRDEAHDWSDVARTRLDRLERAEAALRELPRRIREQTHGDPPDRSCLFSESDEKWDGYCLGVEEAAQVVASREAE